MGRGQAPLTAVEAAIGLLVVLSVSASFVLGVPAAGSERAQLDAYASDAVTLLTNESPRHAGGMRLNEVVSSDETFQRERDTLRRRVDRILPANLMYRVETEYGTVGYPLPDGVPTGTATTSTVGGGVTLRVWYA
jgi:hypothetical protein